MWHVYGCHSLRHAPEHLIRTYSPDNDSVEIRDCGSFLRTIQAVEKSTGIRKEMDISMNAGRAGVKVIHNAGCVAVVIQG